MKYEFEKIKLEDINEDEFQGFESKQIFTTTDWIRFVQEDSKVEPYILRICDSEGVFLGYFSGFTCKKFGIKILGSPFAGWSTCFMGFDLLNRENQYELAQAVAEYAFKKDKVWYIEIIDRHFQVNEARKFGIRVFPVGTLQLNVSLDDEGLFKQMKTDCRNFIRQFERKGATLEFAEPSDTFAEEYYEQLKDVFAKQGLVPTYSLEKVKCLVRELKKSDKLLCVRVRNPEGESIATSLFLGYNKSFFFWGGASYRPMQHYRPNEYMIWKAMQYWRDKGCTTFDMVGIRDYKRKFGPKEEYYAKVVFSKFSVLLVARDIAEKICFLRFRMKGLFKK